MAAGGVTHDNRGSGDSLAGETHGRRHIVQRTGPTSTGLAHPAVFDIGNGKARAGHGIALVAGMQQVIAAAPETTVNIDDQRARSPFGWLAEVYELIGIFTVWNARHL